MSPTAIAPNVHASHGTHQVLKPKLNKTDTVHISSADIVKLEHQYGAHK